MSERTQASLMGLPETGTIPVCHAKKVKDTWRCQVGGCGKPGTVKIELGSAFSCGVSCLCLAHARELKASLTKLGV